MSLESFHGSHSSARTNNFKAMKQTFPAVAYSSSLLKFQCNRPNKNVDLKFLSEDTKIIRNNTVLQTGNKVLRKPLHRW